MNKISLKFKGQTLRIIGILGNLIMLSALFLPWLVVPIYRNNCNTLLYVACPVEKHISEDYVVGTYSIFNLLFQHSINFSLYFWAIILVVIAGILFIFNLWRSSFQVLILRIIYLMLVIIGLLVHFSEIRIVYSLTSSLSYLGIWLPILSYCLMLLSGVTFLSKDN